MIPAVQHGNATFRIALEPLYAVLRLFSAVNIRKALLYQRLYLRMLLSGKQFPKPHRAAEKSVLCRNKKYGDVFLSLTHQRPRSLCRGHSGAYRNVVCGHSAADLIVVKRHDKLQLSPELLVEKLEKLISLFFREFSKNVRRRVGLHFADQQNSFPEIRFLEVLRGILRLEILENVRKLVHVQRAEQLRALPRAEKLRRRCYITCMIFREPLLSRLR